jgi:hypothetical protein
VIFVDTNVFIYAVGRAHPLKAQARSFFSQAIENQQDRLVTSAEVLQELLHAYLPAGRLESLAAALELAYRATDQIWPLEPDDVSTAHALATEYPAPGARNLIQLASCRRRGIKRIQTYDRALAAAFGR